MGKWPGGSVASARPSLGVAANAADGRAASAVAAVGAATGGCPVGAGVGSGGGRAVILSLARNMPSSMGLSGAAADSDAAPPPEIGAAAGAAPDEGPSSHFSPGGSSFRRAMALAV